MPLIPYIITADFKMMANKKIYYKGFLTFKILKKSKDFFNVTSNIIVGL